MKRSAILLASAVLVLAPVACSSGGDSDAGGAGEAVRGDREGTPVERERGGGDGGEGGLSVAQGASGSTLPLLGARVVHRAFLRITVGKDRFESAVREARSLADSLGGFVASSSASQAGRGRLVQGTLVLRVPERSYEEALAGLEELGRVDDTRTASEDISQEFVDLEARARHLEAVERQLLGLLDRARTVPAALAVQSQLNGTQLELEQVRGRLRFLDNQTSLATITLSLRERLPAAVTGDGGWGIVEAWRDGAEAFVQVAGRAFVVIAGAAPVVLLLALGLTAFRVLRRRPLFRWSGSRP